MQGQKKLPIPEKMNEIAMSKLSEGDISQNNVWKGSKSSAEMWREFVDNTTLHGIRYVFMKRHILVRLIWLVLLLTSGGYYIFTVYRAFNKFFDRPINTVISRKIVKEMDFPAVTICSLNLFEKRKVLMTDDNPLFASSGLNISSCAVTASVRGNRPCGLSLICCCVFTEDINDALVIPNCTQEYRQDLLNVIQNSSHRPDLEVLYMHYSQNLSSLAGPRCNFGWQNTPCTLNDFVPMVTDWGMCYTFNSGVDGKPIRKVDAGGVLSGLAFILDANVHEYTEGKFSEGFKVLIHGQGEYIDQWEEGINVGPGQHVVIALSEKRVKYCFIHRDDIFY